MKRFKNIMIIAGKAAFLFLFFLISLYYAPPEILAQNAIQEDTTKYSLDEKDWALQFEIDNNFTLTSFQGTIISVKYHLDTQNALRLGTDIELFTGVRKDNKKTSGYGAGTDEQASTYTINMTFQYVRYPKPTRRILYFYGTGPFFEYTSDSYTFEKENSDSDEEREEMTWSLGISTIIGVECFVTQDISLLGEYGVKAGYYSCKETYAEEGRFEGVNKITTKELFLEPLSVKFGISVYF